MMMLNVPNTTLMLSTFLVSCRLSILLQRSYHQHRPAFLFISQVINVDFLLVFNGRREIPLISHESTFWNRFPNLPATFH